VSSTRFAAIVQSTGMYPAAERATSTLLAFSFGVLGTNLGCRQSISHSLY